ncbi:MAG: ATPase [Alphaproteobacteria bacterium]|nr:MAG: ATPase [Alphaproteobacteria bacterium]
MRRFYKSATAAPDPGGRGFRILLDGRPVHTPAKAVLVVDNPALAEAVAAEWAAQEEEIDRRYMALTALCCTALDLVAPERARVIDEIAAYAGHDLLCYRAEAPRDLAARQQALWQPLLDWAALSYDAPLAVTSGIVSITQPQASLDALRRVVTGASDIELAALASAVRAAGSLIIALALRAGHIDAAAAFEAASLDETYQAERWGRDPEAEARRTAVRDDLVAAARIFALLRTAS